MKRGCAIAAILIGVSCGGGAGLPVAPAPVTVTALSISGLPSTLRVGDRVELTARATYSDGRVGAVSVRWSTKTLSCLVDAAGLLTAIEEGDCAVEATADGARASASIQVEPSRLFTITGVVREKWGVREPPIPFATVTLMSGSQAGRRVTADANGRYEIGGVPKEPVAVRASADDFESNTADASPAAASVDFELEPPLIVDERSFPSLPGTSGGRETIRFTVRHRGPVVLRVSSNYQQCEISYHTIYGAELRGAGGRIASVCPYWTAGVPSPAMGEYRGLLDPGEYTVNLWYSGWFSNGWTRLFYLSRPQ